MLYNKRRLIMTAEKARLLEPGSHIKVRRTGEVLTVTDTAFHAGTWFIQCTDGREYHHAQVDAVKEEVKTDDI